MRILYLSPSGQLGGAERSLLDLLASIRVERPELSLSLVAGEDGPLVFRCVELGVRTEVVPFPAALARLGDAAAGGPAGNQRKGLNLLSDLLLALPAVIIYLRKLRRVIREQRPDILHSNGFKMHVLGLWAKPTGVPIIWHIHDYLSKRPFMARLLRQFAKSSVLCVTNSRSVAADVEAVCGKQLTVKAIYNGVDLKNFAPTGPQLDLDKLSHLQSAIPQTVRVGLLGTFARWKGHEIFLQAMSLIKTDVPLRGYVVGGPLYQTCGSQYSETELKRLAAQFGVSDSIGFTGFIDQPAAAMRALDIVVHASTEPEPFGLVIVEGMACARAVIASAAGGVSEIITEGVDALGHSPGDARALARCIERLAADSGLRHWLGQAGRSTAEQRFDRVQMATNLIPLYQSVTKQSAENKSFYASSERPQWKYLRRGGKTADHFGVPS